MKLLCKNNSRLLAADCFRRKVRSLILGRVLNMPLGKFCEKQTNFITFPVGNYMLKVNNRNTRERCEICSKLTIKTPEGSHWRRSGVFVVNFEHISHLVLVYLLLTLSR